MKQFCKLIRRAISRWKDKRQTSHQNAVEIQSEERKEEQNASSSSVTSTDSQALAGTGKTVICRLSDSIPEYLSAGSLAAEHARQTGRCRVSSPCLALLCFGDRIRVEINSS